MSRSACTSATESARARVQLGLQRARLARGRSGSAASGSRPRRAGGGDRRADALRAAGDQHHFSLQRVSPLRPDMSRYRACRIVVHSPRFPRLATASHSAQLPAPPAEARAHSDRVARLIAEEIARGGGWIRFARYMELALYAPGLGYYRAGARKLGRDGDFVTAPEISPLFGRTLARQVRAARCERGLGDVLEIGAGSGALAATCSMELERSAPAANATSSSSSRPDLRERSRDTLAARAPHLLERVAWLTGCRRRSTGVVIGNEVLDAMPVHVFQRAGGRHRGDGRRARGRTASTGRRAPPRTAADDADPSCFPATATAPRSSSPRAPSCAAWATPSSAAWRCSSTTAFRAREYYHPQRDARHADVPLPPSRARRPVLPARACRTSPPRRFLAHRAGRARGGARPRSATPARRSSWSTAASPISSPRRRPTTPRRTCRSPAQAHKLLSPAEMGELFKVIALGKGVSAPLRGFTQGDRSHTL